MTYPEILTEAWKLHLAPRSPDAPTVISLFAGCGGSSLGYSMAGFRELLAVEWDENAAATFRLNFPDVPVYQGDIAGLTSEAAMRMAGIRPGELDVLDGSPPCQGFSTAGKRDMNDSRNQLFREYIRLLRDLQPRAFVMENVSGMVKGKMKLVFVEILKELKACGYKVSARLMNAMYFEVPQSRARMIFIGTRDGEPTHPVAAHRVRSIHEAIPVPIGTIGYVTASNERHCLAGRLPLRRFDKPMATLVKTGNSRMMDGWKTEPIGPIEASRFASFPDRFQFLKNWQDNIGNSVPPLFMRAIASHIREHVL